MNSRESYRFLHSHDKLTPNPNEEHVLVDKNDWEIARTICKSHFEKLNSNNSENGNGTDMSKLRNMLSPIFNYLTAAENADMQLSNLDNDSAQNIIDSAFKAKHEINEWLKSLNK